MRTWRLPACIAFRPPAGCPGTFPRATVLGTISTAVVYMLSLTVVFGIVPTPSPLSAPLRDGIGGECNDHAC